MNKKLLLISLFLILLLQITSAEEIKLPAAEETADLPALAQNKTEADKLKKNIVENIISPDELLGLTPEKAYSKLGSPEEIFAMRGEVEWQDDVVFYYKNHIYLFWFKNRVWQFRADKRYMGSVLGLKQGLNRNEVNKIMGKPFKNANGADIYLNPKSITRYETGFSGTYENFL